MQTKKRSIVKSLSWRFISTIITLIVAFLLTNNIIISLKLALINMIIKTVLYYSHERVWNNVEWGRV